MMYASCDPGAAASRRVAAATCAATTSSSLAYAQSSSVSGASAVGGGHGSAPHFSCLAMLGKRSETKRATGARAAASTCSPASSERP